MESKANVSDGPTREDLSVVMALGAQFVEPQLPEWLKDLWEGPPGV